MNLNVIKLKLKVLMSDISESELNSLLSKKSIENQILNEKHRIEKEKEFLRKMSLYSNIVKKR